MPIGEFARTVKAARIASAAILVLLTAALVPAPAMSASADRPFQIFDAFLYKGKPSSEALKMVPTNIIYEAQLFPSEATTLALPDVAAVRRAASTASASGRLTIFDIERWPVSATDPAISTSVSNYSQVMRWIKDQSPGLQFGFYALPPIMDYWRSLAADGQFPAWQRDDDSFQFIADGSAALFPCAYTFYEDQKAWVRFAAAQIKEARRQANGKPVYLFLMPTYHDANADLRGQPLPADYWQLELETARSLADGVVLWGGYMQTWDENAAWWTVTKDFIGQTAGMQATSTATAPSVPTAPVQVRVQ